MTRCGNPKNQDSHSAWKSLAKGARLSHIYNTGPTVIITYSELLTGGGGPNQTIKSGPDRVDKPSCGLRRGCPRRRSVSCNGLLDGLPGLIESSAPSSRMAKLSRDLPIELQTFCTDSTFDLGNFPH